MQARDPVNHDARAFAAGFRRHGHLRLGRAVADDAEQVSCRAVAQHRARTAREYRGHQVAVQRRRQVTDRVDAVMNPPQAPVRDPARDPAAVDPRRQQLLARDTTVPVGCHPRDEVE